MRKTTGYFLAGSKFGGFTSQYWMSLFSLPTLIDTVIDSGSVKATRLIQGLATSVSFLTPEPSVAARKISPGAVSEDLANTRNPGPGCGLEIEPPRTMLSAAPPAAGTEKRLSRPSSAAVNQILRPSASTVKSLIEMSG